MGSTTKKGDVEKKLGFAALVFEARCARPCLEPGSGVATYEVVYLGLHATAETTCHSRPALDHDDELGFDLADLEDPETGKSQQRLCQTATVTHVTGPVVAVVE
jgi:hypothetical protein